MFFKNIEDYKKYVSVNGNFKFEEISVYLNDINGTILSTYLGDTFLEELKTAFNNAVSFDALTGKQKVLIGMLRESTSRFALIGWMPLGQVSIDQAGIRIAKGEHHATAFQWQIKDIKEQLNELGFNALDRALLYLEKNLNDFNTYKTSDEYKENTSLFVSSAKEFAKHCSPFKNSCINFIKIRSIIKTVEDFSIKSTILPDYFNDLKTKIAAGEVLGANAKIIVEMIKPALVNLTVALAVNELAASLTPQNYLVFDNTGGRETIDNQKQAGEAALNRIATAAANKGKTYLDILAKYIEKNKDNYPLFKNDALYVLPEQVVEVNSGNKTFFSGF